MTLGYKELKLIILIKMEPLHVMISERYGGIGGSTRKYMIVGDTVRIKDKSSDTPFTDKAKQTVKEIFLPQGYPDSVSDDYLSYQLWDTMQAFCSYITGTLATQAMLKGVGVGDSSASPIAATITWILKGIIIIIIIDSILLLSD
jgi:hypothetical protein